VFLLASPVCYLVVNAKGFINLKSDSGAFYSKKAEEIHINTLMRS
jgi:hypothetical protein